MKKCIRCVCFLLAAAVMIKALTVIFIPKWYGTWQSTRIVDGFYELPEDSVDVVILGSSQAIMGLSSMGLYEESGIAACGIGTEEQPMYATYYWLMEALRFQSPSVVVLEVNELLHSSTEAAYRKAFEYMKWSEVKREAVTALCETDDEQSLFSYIFPLYSYHDRWNELTPEDFEYLYSDKTDPYLGFVVSDGYCEYEYSGFIADTDEEPDEANEEEYEYFMKIVSKCREEGIELVLVKTPRVNWTASKHNMVEQIADEEGLIFIDFNEAGLLQEVDFNYQTDARDASHLNIYGAEKISGYLAGYLSENLGLADRRGDAVYAWLDEMSIQYDDEVEYKKSESDRELTEWLESSGANR